MSASGSSSGSPGLLLADGNLIGVSSDVFEDDRVSLSPAYLMNNALTSEDSVEVAMMGRVPCRVVGKIRKGDMLVTSKENGVATASEDPTLGTVIGKALQNYDSDQIGEIEIVVGKL